MVCGMFCVLHTGASLCCSGRSAISCDGCAGHSWADRAGLRAHRVLHGMVSPKRPEPQQDQRWVCGRGFLGFTANPQHTFGPSWIGSWLLLAIWDQRFSWAHGQHTTPFFCFNTSRKTFVHNVLTKNGYTAVVIAKTDTRQTATQHHTNSAHQQRAALPMQVNHSWFFPTPTYSLSVFEMTIFRNSTLSGTEFYCP